jgi:hypothetical protein
VVPSPPTHTNRLAQPPPYIAPLIPSGYGQAEPNDTDLLELSLTSALPNVSTLGSEGFNIEEWQRQIASTLDDLLEGVVANNAM